MILLTENLRAQNVGGELVFSVDLCYNGMGDIMEDLKKRKTTRLNGADYNRNQAVFLTICTKERQCILSRIVGTGGLLRFGHARGLTAHRAVIQHPRAATLPRRSANRIDKIRTNRR